MAKRSLLILAWLVAFVCFPVSGWAQEARTITGTVTSSEDGEPLPGASVVVPGTNTGTATNADGEYELSVPPDAEILRFSYVGFSPEEVEIGDRTTIDVALAPDYQALDEVLVVGYGTQIQRDVTGNIARISSEDIENVPVNSLESAIQGRAAGVQIQSGSGKLGQGIQVRIRGASSVSADNQPLYVVDGIPVTTENLSSNGAPTNPISDLSISDIESVEILKDASAAAIYGARASNGVVLITTKSGQAGTTQFSVNYQHSWSSPTNTVDWMNAQEYADYFLESASNAGELEYELGYFGTREEAIADWVAYAESELDYLARGTDWRNGVVDTDWQEQAFRDAGGNKLDISARGGSENTQFYLSGSLDDQRGILIRDDFQRITGRLNLDHQFSNYFTVGGKLNLIRTINNRVSNDNAFSNPMQLVAQAPISPVYYPETEGVSRNDGYLSEYIPTGELNNETLYFNGLLYIDNVRYNTTIFRSLGNAYAELRVLPELSVRSEFGVDVLDQNEDEYYNSRVARNTGAEEGLGYNTWNRVVNYTTNNFLTYGRAFADVHDVEVTAGMSYQASTVDEVFVQGERFPNDDFTQIESAAEITGGASSETDYRFLSYFARANYKFDDRYILNLSGRYDGSSRFGANNRYGFFPSASVGWVLTEESFLEGSDTFSFLKLRASYGLTGNAEIGNFAWPGLWDAEGYGGVSGISPVQTPNPDLKWERTAQLDVGIDFGFFNNRINGEIDYYLKNTEDLLLSVNVPGTTGFASQLRNVGKLRNEGFEIAINTNNFVGSDFNWSTSFNFATNRNEITDLNDQVIEGGFINRAVEGEPLGVFYAREYAGVNADNGDGLYYLNREPTQDEIDSGTAFTVDGRFDGRYVTPSSNAAERVVIGNPNPDFTGGFGNEFSYKGFSLDVLFEFVYGNQVYDGGGRYKTANGLFFDNQRRSELDAWQEPGDITDVPEARLFYDNGTADSDRYLYDASYLRLRNVRLSYSLPASLLESLRFDNATIYVTGTNLLTFTDYPWWDPEVNADAWAGNIGQGNEFYTAPQARTISTGIRFGF